MTKKKFTIRSGDLQLGDRAKEVSSVQAYLRKFGYLTDASTSAEVFDDATREAIATLQRAMGVPVSGMLDEATRRVMELPRCGVPEPSAALKDAVAKYVLRGCDYQSRYRTLTYGFTNASGDIAGDGEREAVRKAFATWKQYIPMDFLEVSPLNQPVFPIGWFRGNHGDGSSFDGVGRVIAHAFYPPPCGGSHAGSCHFDEDESWGLSHSSDRLDLESVALHEIGHLLGLEHSNVPGSVMYPTYSGQLRELTADDVAGVQAMYGKPGPAMRLTVHLQGFGDAKFRDNEFGGTRGQSRRLEGFQIEIATEIPDLSLTYMAHLQGIGDTQFVPEGQFVGTRGQSRRLEGFAIRLTGAQSPNYTVKYMAHLQGTGNTRFHADGEFCGTRGQYRRVEGMLVRIERRG